RRLPIKGAFDAPAGSVVDMITPGSGGYGAPAEREPSAIGRDLLDGYVTAQAVRDSYAHADPETLLAAAKQEDDAGQA
ncbi:MAG: hypothetical protein ACK5JT_22405, partial [Hyphomicrobiaceae bacterium]